MRARPFQHLNDLYVKMIKLLSESPLDVLAYFSGLHGIPVLGERLAYPRSYITFYCTPLAEPFFDLLSATAEAKSSRTVTVVSQSMQASVMETPFFRPLGPSAGTFWLPSLMLDSIMTPTMPVSPPRIWVAMSLATRGWFRWFLLELPVTALAFFFFEEPDWKVHTV